MVVIGVGNDLRGDDAVGLVVARRVRAGAPEGVRVLECEQEPSRLLDAWRGVDAAYVIDACASGGTPGTVHRFDASGDPVPASGLRSSTHAFGVGDAVELARALGELPPRVVVYGIEGADFTPGGGLGAAVTEAAERVAAALATELAPGGGRHA